MKTIPDQLIVPVMIKHSISREEAEKRLQALLESGILQNGHPADPETQAMIDVFLAQDSEILAETVLFEKCFTQCIESKDFVANYDRLSGSKLSNMLRQMEKGATPKKWKKEFEKFQKFIRATVWAKFEKEVINA